MSDKVKIEVKETGKVIEISRESAEQFGWVDSLPEWPQSQEKCNGVMELWWDKDLTVGFAEGAYPRSEQTQRQVYEFCIRYIKAYEARQ